MKERDSGIELLRVIAMLMVILIHGFWYGNFHPGFVSSGEVYYEFLDIIRLSFRPAVNIFILITGYFMARSKFDLKKSFTRAWDTYSRVLFYSVILTVIFLILGPEYCIPARSAHSMEIKEIILKGIFPLSSQTWYYLTNYILLCIFSPYINIVLQNLNKKDYKTLLIVATLFMSIWMSLIKIYPFSEWFSIFTFSDIIDGKSIFSFIYIYIIGGYIGMHVQHNNEPKFTYLYASFFCLMINYLLSSILSEDVGYQAVSMNYSNPFVILQGVFMLLFFKDLHFHSRIINILASTTLGVYAIHEFTFVRSFLWEKLFDFSKTQERNLLFLILISLLIFIVLAIIDLAVQKLFKSVKSVIPKIKNNF